MGIQVCQRWQSLHTKFIDGGIIVIAGCDEGATGRAPKVCPSMVLHQIQNTQRLYLRSSTRVASAASRNATEPASLQELRMARAKLHARTTKASLAASACRSMSIPASPRVGVWTVES